MAGPEVADRHPRAYFNENGPGGALLAAALHHARISPFAGLIDAVATPPTAAIGWLGVFSTLIGRRRTRFDSCAHLERCTASPYDRSEGYQLGSRSKSSQ